MSDASPSPDAIDPRLERLLYARLIIQTCMNSARALSPLMQGALFQAAVVAYYAALSDKQDRMALCSDPTAKRLFKKYRKLRNKAIAHIGDIEKPQPVALEWVELPELPSDSAEYQNDQEQVVYLEITRFDLSEFEEFDQLIAMTYALFKNE